MSIEPKYESVTVTAQDTFTDEMDVLEGDVVSVSFVKNTFVGTIVLQRKFPQDSGSDWADVPNPDGTIGWTASTQQSYDVDERCQLRIGCKTGGYTSGSGVCRLGKG